MSPDASETAMEDRIFQRILAHVDEKMCDIVKAHIQPALQLLIEQDNSVFDATFLDSPADAVSHSSMKHTSDGVDDRLKSLEDIIENQVKKECDKMRTFLESYRTDRKAIMTSFEEVHRNIAVLKSSIEQNTELIYVTNQKVKDCEPGILLGRDG